MINNLIIINHQMTVCISNVNILRLLYIRFLKILRNRDRALVEGVLGDGLVGVDWTQTLKGYDLVISGITGCILNHIELEIQTC